MKFRASRRCLQARALSLSQHDVFCFKDAFCTHFVSACFSFVLCFQFGLRVTLGASGFMVASICFHGFRTLHCLHLFGVEVLALAFGNAVAWVRVFGVSGVSDWGIAVGLGLCPAPGLGFRDKVKVKG